MIKLIFCDMDGTLLDPAGNLPAGFGDCFRELKRRGVLFVPASGRQYYSLLESFGEFKDEMYFVAENGTVVRSGLGETVYLDTFDDDDVSYVLDELKTDFPSIYPVICSDEAAIIDKKWAKYLPECTKYYTKWRYYDGSTPQDVLKIALCDCEGRDAERNIYSRLVVPADLKILLSGEIWVDIMQKESDKARGAKKLIEHLGLQPSECAAFGDYLNDIELMQTVEHSFAMANAHQDLKAVAKYETGSNAEGGVMKKIYELIDKGLI